MEWCELIWSGLGLRQLVTPVNKIMETRAS
jgi:hypothetical protein